jgi:hypothetical protein
MAAPILDPTRQWQCPSCGAEHQTREHRPHIPMHTCPALNGLSAPFVEAGTDAIHRVMDREDYVGAELVQTDNTGRPVMALRTERADGSNDCHVYAATAQASADNTQ